MNMAAFGWQRPRWVWTALLLVSVGFGVVVGGAQHRSQAMERLELLQTQAQRSSLALTAQTLDGQLMGAISLLGLMDANIQREADNQPLTNPEANLESLRILGQNYGAEGVFVVGKDGIVKSSWDRANQPSTGLDIRFRPYFQSAMQGKTSVYAAVSMARGDRSVYFAAPIRAASHTRAPVVGALVARHDVTAVDRLLSAQANGALLLAPQGVVFASSNARWQGMMEGPLDAQRLQAVRQLKQFGAQFEKATPEPLPFSAQAGLQILEGRTWAVAPASLDWNDPAGPWTLVLLEDLTRTVPQTAAVVWGAGGASVLMLLAWMALRLHQQRLVQQQAHLRLQAYAQQQEAQVVFRRALSQLSLALQRQPQVGERVQVFLQECRALLGVVQGVVYLVDAPTPNRLLLAGSCACASPPPEQILVGQTLLGQYALQQEPQVVETPPQGIWTVRSGLGQTAPAALVLWPMRLQGKLLGVAELALMHAPSAQELEHMGDALAVLGSALEALVGPVRDVPVAMEAAA